MCDQPMAQLAKTEANLGKVERALRALCPAYTMVLRIILAFVVSVLAYVYEAMALCLKRLRKVQHAIDHVLTRTLRVPHNVPQALVWTLQARSGRIRHLYTRMCLEDVRGRLRAMDSPSIIVRENVRALWRNTSWVSMDGSHQKLLGHTLWEVDWRCACCPRRAPTRLRPAGRPPATRPSHAARGRSVAPSPLLLGRVLPLPHCPLPWRSATRLLRWQAAAAGPWANTVHVGAVRGPITLLVVGTSAPLPHHGKVGLYWARPASHGRALSSLVHRSPAQVTATSHTAASAYRPCLTQGPHPPTPRWGPSPRFPCRAGRGPGGLLRALEALIRTQELAGCGGSWWGCQTETRPRP